MILLSAAADDWVDLHQPELQPNGAKNACDNQEDPEAQLRTRPQAARPALRAVHGPADNMAVNGVLVPILVNGNGTRRKIIDGNYRKAIADELGYDCPEIVQAGLTEEEKRTLARALNLARRQLSNDQKRQLIADQLRETARPSDSVTGVGRRTRVPKP